MRGYILQQYFNETISQSKHHTKPKCFNFNHLTPDMTMHHLFQVKSLAPSKQGTQANLYIFSRIKKRGE